MTNTALINAGVGNQYRPPDQERGGSVSASSTARISDKRAGWHIPLFTRQDGSGFQTRRGGSSPHLSDAVDSLLREKKAAQERGHVGAILFGCR